MSLFSRITELSSKAQLGEDSDNFVAQITHTNLIRIRIMSIVSFALFFILWIWDIVQYVNGKWNESAGYSIITYTHSFLLIFLVGTYVFCRKIIPDDYNLIKSYHKIFKRTVLSIVLFCTSFLALGDVLTSGSIAAYLGMVFAYAAIFITKNVFSFLLYGINMAVMVILLATVQIKTNQPMNIQIINTVSFTIAAFIMSRVLYHYYM